MTPGPVSQGLALVVGCIAFISVALALLAYSMPLERRVPAPVEYEHQGEFSYRAEVDGTVYPDGVARTGDPVYRKLAGDMDVRFDYRLGSEAGATAQGTYRLDAVIRMDDGWTRQLAIVDETAFTGAEAAIEGVLSLEAIQAEVDSARAQTGLDSQPLRSYAVDLVPVVNVQATVAEMPVQEVFSPRLQLVVEPLVIRVATGGPSAEEDVFRPALTGTLQQRQVVANSIGLPGHKLDVGVARGIAQIGLGLSVAGGLLLVVVIAVASGGDEPSRIRARYGPLLVALRGIDVGDDGRLIEVESIEDLAKVAEREGRMILHRECGSVHQYFVQDVDVTYRYQTRPLPVAQRRPGVGRIV